jgi:hypothetical protein
MANELPLGIQSTRSMRSVRCLKAHRDGKFTIGKSYKISATRETNGTISVVIRDDRRERLDFNFIPRSRNYFWRYFALDTKTEDI